LNYQPPLEFASVLISSKTSGAFVLDENGSIKPDRTIDRMEATRTKHIAKTIYTKRNRPVRV
jgi:hypothetical protein